MSNKNNRFKGKSVRGKPQTETPADEQVETKAPAADEAPAEEVSQEEGLRTTDTIPTTPDKAEVEYEAPEAAPASVEHSAKGADHPMAAMERPPGFQFVKHEEFVVVKPFVEGSTPLHVGDDYSNPHRLHRLYRRRRIMPKGFRCTELRLEAYRASQEAAEANTEERNEKRSKSKAKETSEKHGG